MKVFTTFGTVVRAAVVKLTQYLIRVNDAEEEIKLTALQQILQSTNLSFIYI